jgi:glutamate--cysteine ligase
VPRRALATPFRGRPLRRLALDLLEIARGGLRRRGRRGAGGTDETQYLDVLFATAESGRTLADEMVEAFGTKWGENVDPLFADYAY